MLFQENFKLRGAKIGQQFVAGHECRRVSLARQPHHFLESGLVVFHIQFLVGIAAGVKVPLGVYAPGTPRLDIQL